MVIHFQFTLIMYWHEDKLTHFHFDTLEIAPTYG